MRRISRFRVRIECTPRGAYAPRSCVAVRVFAGEKRFLRCTYAHPIRSGGRQPAVVRDTDAALQKSSIVPRPTDARLQERRASARRGCGKHVCVDKSAIVRRTADGVCAGRRCIRGNSYHGGLTPPALVLQFERLPTKKRFLRCTNAHPIKSGGRQPPWFGNGTGKGDAANVRGMALCANVEHTQRTVGGHCDPRDVRGTALCANVEQGGLWKRPCVFRIMDGTHCRRTVSTDATRCRGTIAMDGTRCEQPP
jgi:hypothetical protein